MRSKKWLTIVTGLISITSLITIVLYPCASGKLYDIIQAFFGGAALGFIMSFTEYFPTRRAAMERFWDEGFQCLRIITKVKPIALSEPPELLIDAIREKRYANIHGEAFNNLCHYIEQKNLISRDENTSDDMYEAMLESYSEDKINTAEEQFKDHIESLRLLLSLPVHELDTAYGDLDFFFNKKVREELAYKNILLYVRNLKNAVAEQDFHFKLLDENKGNFAICCMKALQLDKLIFKTESDSSCVYKIYNDAADQLEQSLEDFRVRIYRGAKAEKSERNLVLAKGYNLDDEDQKRR